MTKILPCLIFLAAGIQNANCEELHTEVAYGLVSMEFADTNRTDPAMQINFSKPLGNLIEIKIGYSQLGSFDLVDQTGTTDQPQKVRIQGANISLSKGLKLPDRWLVEYGLGILRWKETRSTSGQNSAVRSGNDLQIQATLYYELENNTHIGFMYTETNTDIAHMRTVTCNLKFELNI